MYSDILYITVLLLTVHHINLDGILKLTFFYFFFLNIDFSFTICDIHPKLFGYVQNIALEGRVSQNYDLGPGFIFMI